MESPTEASDPAISPSSEEDIDTNLNPKLPPPLESLTQPPSEGPRLSKNSNIRMTTTPQQSLRDNPILGAVMNGGLGDSALGPALGPSLGTPIGPSLGSSSTTSSGGSSNGNGASGSGNVGGLGPLLGPMLQGKSAFNTQQVVDEANTDNFTTVTTKMKDMVSLLEKASDDDKTLVLFELQQVVEFDRNFVVENILPVICANAAKWEESVQVPAAEALSTVLRSSISAEMAMKVCNVACDVIFKTKDQANGDLWGEVLVTSLKFCSWTAAELDRIVKRLRGDQGVEGRSATSKLTARILGAMAVSSVDHETKRVVLDRAVAMTTDEDEEVRGIIAESMAYIGASLSAKEVEVNQWPTLHRLSQDENACVRGACLKSISSIAEKHRGTNTAKLYRFLLPSLFYKECTKMRRFAVLDIRSIDEDSYLIVEINSEIFGTMLKCCYEFLPDDTSRKEVFKAFLSMATCNSPVIRKNCASNLPEAAKHFGEKGSVMLTSLVEYLSHDSDDETRSTLASKLHEILPHMANRETIAQSFKAVLVLLQDENWIVRQKLVEHFQNVVESLSKYCTYNASGKMSTLFEQLQRLCEGDWRVQELLVKQLQLTAPLVPPTSMTGNILPLLDRISREGTYLVRKAAMGSIATYIRYVPDSLDRNRIMRKFSEDWAHGSVYWMRIGFIDAAKVAIPLYSRCLFRDMFGLEVLKLASDPVSNVRLRLAMLLPEMAPACYLMDEYEIALNKLKNDSVFDVYDVAHASEEKIETMINEGKKKFEEDLKLEDEERELYSRHLQNQREANKKKNNIKKAAGGWWQNKLANITTKLEDVDSPVTPARKTSAMIKSNSVCRDDPEHPEETQSAEWERSAVEPLYVHESLGGSKDDSDIFRRSRSFRGFRPFLPGKSGSVMRKRHSVMIKKP